MIIKGRFVDYRTNKKYMQVEVGDDDGIIKRIGENFGHSDLNFGSEYIIFTGLIDPHVHMRFRQPQKEDYLTGSRAAVNGGVTCAFDMPNHEKPPNTLENLLEKQKAAEASHIPIIVYGAISPNMLPVKEAVIHKLYTTSVGPIELHHTTQEAVENSLAKCTGLKVAGHCEDNAVIEENKNNAKHIDRRPAIAEEKAIRYFSESCIKYGVTGIVCHISSAHGFAAVQQRMLKEAAPHYLYFNLDDIEKYPAYKAYGEQFFNVNPSLKTKYDMHFLLQRFKRGEFDLLGSDHAPHTKEDKLSGMSGFSGLDIFGAFVGHMINDGMDAQLLSKICSYNPAQLVGLNQGLIQKGYIGSFTVINLKKPTNITTEFLQTKNAENTPWLGETLSASVEATIVKGKICKAKGQMLV